MDVNLIEFILYYLFVFRIFAQWNLSLSKR